LKVPFYIKWYDSSDTSYAVARHAGGLEGLRPSKNYSSLVVLAGFAGKNHQRIEILGRLCLPKLLHRVRRVK
jgi:hypothetical protein